jgi:hypothetical protein
MRPSPAAGIREAFEAGEFVRARRLWEEHAAGLEAAIAAGSAGETAMAETRELIEWARQVVAVFRTCSSERLREARVAQIYSCQP